MKISVIIATYNRAPALKDVLADLRGQTIQPSLLEVIVVDNNSSDNTREIVNDLIASFGGRLKYYFEERQGKTFALNKGISTAQGEILAFTDDDVRLDPRWLDCLLSCFKDYGCDAAGGRVLPAYPEKTPQWIKDNKCELCGPIVLYDYGEQTKKYDVPMAEFVGANVAFMSTVFKEAGPFRTDLGPGQGTFGEDSEMVRRLYKMDKSLYYCAEALVWHPVDIKRMNLRYIARWNFDYGKFLGDRERQVIPKATVFYGRVPRYLIRELIFTIGRMVAKILVKKDFLNYWIEFNRLRGRLESFNGQKKNKKW